LLGLGATDDGIKDSLLSLFNSRDRVVKRSLLPILTDQRSCPLASHRNHAFLSNIRLQRIDVSGDFRSHRAPIPPSGIFGGSDVVIYLFCCCRRAARACSLRVTTLSRASFFAAAKASSAWRELISQRAVERVL
jgi:hypothetical protein